MLQLSEFEKKQLIRALFLTTGPILSALFYREGNFLYAIPGIGVFFLALYLADKSGNNKLLYYAGAVVIWFVMYKIFQHAGQ